MDTKKIYRPYTPSRHYQEVLERVTVGRDDLLSDLLASIKEQAAKITHQHWLLVGPRGIGKSHIIALIQHRVRTTPDLNERWLTVWFPEEAAGIITLRDFMEKVTRLCSVGLTEEGLSDHAQRFDKILESTHEEANDRKAVNRIKAFLVDWSRRTHRKILVLLENADRLIGKRIAKRRVDEKWLRDLLMNEDLFLFIATAPTFFEQVLNKDHPLYELFRIEVIEDLTVEESLELLIRYATDEGRTDLVQAFKIKTNRLQALHTLTGGSPRLLIILYILVQSSVENISDLETGFYNLLEELTPYFQARMAQLGANEEKVLVAFAEGPELLTPAEVGRRIRMATNVVTATLKRLQSAGFIKRIEQPIKGRKGTLYRLSETIFRYWYQMNSERSREMAEIFVKFIVLFYTYPEIKKIYTSQQIGSQKTEKVLTMASAASQKLRYLEAAMDKLRTTETERLLTSLKEKRKEKAPHDTIRKIFDELIEINPDDPPLLNSYAVFLCELGDLKTAIPLFRKIAELGKQKEHKTWRCYAYYNWGTALLDLAELKGDEGLFQESFEKYALAVKYKQDYHGAYNNWGTALLDLARLKGDEGLFQESFEKYALAVKYKQDMHEAYNNWGTALLDLAELKGDEGLFQESFEKYALAVKYKQDYHVAYYNWGNALSDLARLKGDEGLFQESFEKYALAVKYKQDYHGAYNNWGTALLDLARLKGDEGLFQESFEKYALAVKYKQDMHEAYYNWGNALSDLARLKGDEGLFQESFEKYALVVKYKQDYHGAYYNWGNALSDLARLKGDEGLFQESFEKYALAVKYKQDYHGAYYNWGNALSDLARLKGDEGLFQESFEKYALAVKYKQDYHGAYNNWGNALSDLAEIKGDEGLFQESFEKYALAVKYKQDMHEAYYNWGTALLDLARLKGDEGLFQESFEKYALAVKYKQDYHVAYYNWGNALSDLAELKGDEGLFQESFEKYVTAWSLTKRLAKLDHPLMVNTGLKTVMGACIVGEGDEADHTFMEIVGVLSKVVDLKATSSYFFDFFESLPRKAEIAVARNYLEQLLKSKFKKELRVLVPFRFFYEYLEHHDDTIIRRQPSEIQKVLNEMIRRAEKRE